MITITGGTRAGRRPALVNQPPMAAGVTPIGPGEDGLSNALHRERARYHERQAALLARVLRRTPKPAPGEPDPAG